MLQRLHLLCLLGLVGMGIGIALADDPVIPKTPPGVVPKSEVPRLVSPKTLIISPQENDQRIARWLAVDNRMLVDSSKLAEARTENKRLKEFAHTLTTDHDQVQENLKMVITPKVVNAEGTEVIPEAKTATLIQDAGQSRAGKLVYAPTDFISVKEKVCGKLKAKMEQELSALKAAEFDHAYLAHVIMSHEALIATLNTVNGDATEQLRNTLEDLRQTAEKHLKQAIELRQELEHPNKEK